MDEAVKHITGMEIPAMTSQKVHDYLQELGSGWKKKGVAMEIGCWLGASATPLLIGLNKAGYDKQFWAFDRWIANDQQVQMSKDSATPLKLNQDVRPIFIENVKKVYWRIVAVKGMVPGGFVHYDRSPIEICILDAPKKEPVFTDCIKYLSQFWIPGVTVLGLLDYNFYKEKQGSARNTLLAPVRFMEKHKECFEVIKRWDTECPVFFRYVKELKV